MKCSNPIYYFSVILLLGFIQCMQPPPGVGSGPGASQNTTSTAQNTTGDSEANETGSDGDKNEQDSNEEFPSAVEEEGEVPPFSGL